MGALVEGRHQPTELHVLVNHDGGLVRLLLGDVLGQGGDEQKSVDDGLEGPVRPRVEERGVLEVVLDARGNTPGDVLNTHTSFRD